MTQAEKVLAIRSMLPDNGSTITEAQITSYLSLSSSEILSWLYSTSANVPEGVTSIPDKYVVTQLHAVVAGLGVIGGANQKTHSENGISRDFVYSDMVDYIHAHVTPYLRVVGEVNV